MNLLVVDDIPTIADGVATALTELESEAPGGLELLVAYSGEEALAILENTAVEIVVSDIRMPKITGIDLLREVRDRWPRCKVIFLSGHDEFNYAQQAMRFGAFRYVLKVEGDERLISVVREAIRELDLARERDALWARIEEQLAEARPLLRQEYLRSLIESGATASGGVRSDPHELGIPLDLSARVRLVLGRVDTPGELGKRTSSRHRVAYAIASILDSVGDDTLVTVSVELPVDRFAILAQGSRNEDDSLLPLLERLQERLEATSGTRVSLAASDREVYVDELHGELLRLRERLSRSLGAVVGSLVVAESPAGRSDAVVGEGAKTEADARRESDRAAASEMPIAVDPVRGSVLDVLRVQLENRNRERFLEAFEPLYRSIQDQRLAPGARLAAFHAASSALLAHLSRNPTDDSTHDDLAILYRGPTVDELDDAAERLRRLVEQILRTGEREVADSRLGVVRAVREYCDDNLDSVSLTSVADHVDLNPSYLSRLYKETTGESLSNYIAERRLELARDLLENTDLLVQAIALEVGYQSTISFDRFFKGRLGVTPHEYRDSRRG